MRRTPHAHTQHAPHHSTPLRVTGAPPRRLSRGSLQFSSLITLELDSAIGLAIIYFFHGITPGAFFGDGAPVVEQLLHGLFAGVVSFTVIYHFMELPFMRGIKNTYSLVHRTLGLKWWQIIVCVVCTVTGEEILFRGALQQWIGIYPTAVLFVALHGYLTPTRGLAMFLYGVVHVCISAGFGFLYELSGIYAAIAAHAVVDAGIFAYYANGAKRTSP